MAKTVSQVEKNVSASFGYVKKDMLMLNDAFSDLHDKVQHLSMNHAALLDEIRRLREQLTGKKASLKSKSVKKKTKPLKTTKSAKKAKSKRKDKDDLSKIEGIGPAIRNILYKNKITSFKDLSKQKVSNLRKILKKAGPEYIVHDPKTWPRQATMAKNEQWNKLEKLQAKLKGGL